MGFLIKSNHCFGSLSEMKEACFVKQMGGTVEMWLGWGMRTPEDVVRE